MYSHLSDVQRHLNNGQKIDSFADHFEQHFKSTVSLTDLLEYDVEGIKGVQHHWVNEIICKTGL